MSILNNIIRGASFQFGREFGRAGANIILKGKNSYRIETDKKYESRINPSDSELVKRIKGIKKIKFLTTDKSNLIKLLELQNDVLNSIKFEGINSIYVSSDLNALLSEYESKYNFGLNIIEDKSNNLFKDILSNNLKIETKTKDYNSDLEKFVMLNYNNLKITKKNRKTTILLSVPLLGFQWFYLKENLSGVLSILLSFLVIPLIINFIALISLLVMNDKKFDEKYNHDFTFFKNLKHQI